MELGSGLRARGLELEKRGQGFLKRLEAIAQSATMRAVETATELTPPNTFEEDEVRGTNMITGALAQHWASDSKIKPEKGDSRFATVLANKMEYASYINDGHRVKKRFVPGLYIDPETGLLSYDPKRKEEIGLPVGTKTTYVEGLYMTDQAKAVYEEVADRELDKLTREVLGP